MHPFETQIAVNQPAVRSAPYDITRYWIALVTDDWRYRNPCEENFLEHGYLSLGVEAAIHGLDEHLRRP